MYKARNGHMRVSQIDEALCSGNLRALMVLSDLENFDSLLSNSVDSALSLNLSVIMMTVCSESQI